MKIVFASLVVLIIICLLNSAAAGAEALATSKTPTIQKCTGSTKDCGKKTTVTKAKKLVINLTESLTMDSNDKKPSYKQKEKTITKNSKELQKAVKIKKQPKKTIQKTKHDTVKNSISNVR